MSIISGVKKRITYSSLLVSVLLAAFIMFEWITAGTFYIGNTKTNIGSYIESDSFLIKGYDVNGQEYYRNNSKAYIVIPINDFASEVEISVDNLGIENLNVKVYRNVFGSEEYQSYKSINDVNGIIRIGVPSDTNRIRLNFENNINKSIKIEGVNLYTSTIIFNARLVVTATCMWFILSLLLLVVISYVKRRYGNNDVQIFFFLLLAAEVMFAFVNLLTSGYYWGTYFFPNAGDSFMDYFKSLVLLNNTNPYYLKASYPAMCFVLLNIMRLFLPLEIRSLTDAVELRGNMIAMFGFIVLLIIILYVLSVLFAKALGEEYSKAKVLILLLSGPVLFTIQRGNILLLSFVFILIYYLYYDSEDKKKRYLAYFALAIAASIKVYPALFGLLTLKKKRYKEAVHLTIIGFLMFVLPFFYFDGFKTLRRFFVGLNAAGTVMTGQGVGQNISLENLKITLNIIMGTNIPSMKIVMIVMTVALLVTAYFAKKQWETLFLIAVACVWYPDFSFTYTLLLFYPAIFSAIRERECVSKKELYSLSILMMPLCLPYMKWVDNYIDPYVFQMPMAIATVVFYFIIFAFVFRIIIGIFLQKAGKLSEITVKKLDIGIISALICFMIVLVGVNFNRTYSNKYEFDGKGTKDCPYVINNADDFIYLADTVNSGEKFIGAYFVQTGDITFDGITSVDPIGWAEKNAEFCGIYNGQGYSIINYYSMSDNDENMGVFGVLSGKVINLNLHNCNISGESSGGIAYKVMGSGVIANCFVNGSLNGYYTGDIAVHNLGTIENCAAFVNASSNKSYDIASIEENGRIINSYDNNSSVLSKLDSKSMERLNSHVDINNKGLLKDSELCYWEFNENYFISVTNDIRR